MKKILVIQTASLGDVVLATSLIETIHISSPSASIDFLIKDGFQSLFIGHPFINNIIVWNKRNHKYKNLFLLLKAARHIKYDEVYNIQRFGSMAFFTISSKAKLTSGFRSNLLSRLYSYSVRHLFDGRHEIDRNVELLKPIYGPLKAALPRLYPMDCISLANFGIVGKFIVLAPGSLWKTKQWPLEMWVELCRQLPNSLAIVLTGVENEKDLCNSILEKSGKKNIFNLAGLLNLSSLVSLVSQASYIFANDSAMTHIASALNKPISTIFCSTVPKFGFSPLGENAKVFEPEQNLSCRPCGIHGFNKCPLNHFNCGNFFSVSKIIELTLHQ